MSAVNTAQGTPAPQTPASSAARSGPGTAALRKTGAETGEDLFANLLTLMSDTRAGAQLTPPAETPVADPQDDDTAATSRDGGAMSLLAGWPLETRTADAWASDGAKSTGAVDTGAIPPRLGRGPSGNGRGALEMPAGMTAVSDGTALDPESAAALAAAREAAPSDAPARASPAAPFMADRHSRTAGAAGAGLSTAAATQGLQWRKASAAGASDSQGVTVSAAAPFSDAAQLRPGGARPTARSTVGLHDRFGSSLSSSAGNDATAASEPASGSTVGWVSALSGAAPGDARTASDSLAAGEAGTESRPAESSDPAATGTPDSAADRAAQASEAEARQVSHWSTQTLRHASLRVGQEGADAIDIRLSLAGQEVQVDFRTDDASARASLQQNASDSLAGLLQRSGIQLGGVSVGAQGPGHGLPQEQPGHDSRPGAGRSRAPAGSSRLGPGGADSAPPIPVARPRADGSQGLDVFA